MRMRKTIGLSLLLVVASTAALAKQTQSAQHQPTACVKAKPTKTANTGKTRAASARQPTGHMRSEARAGQRDSATGRRATAGRPTCRSGTGHRRARGRLGSLVRRSPYRRRTASGDRLDAVRATAAHRSLPLHSLVRVTNLRNGRSVIARINDRGPVSRNLLIDLSPRAADEIDMKRAGIATVAIEPVAPAAANSGGKSDGTPGSAIGQPARATARAAKPLVSQLSPFCHCC